MTILPMTINLQDAHWYPANADRAGLCLRFIARRFLASGILIVFTFFVLLRMFYSGDVIVGIPNPSQETPPPRWPGMRLPPLYSQYHQYELALPQHHWHAKSHDSEPKSLFVSGHTWGVGWGNVMQEILLNAYLSYKSNRAFVFYNYTWNLDASQDYTDYSGKPIPSRVPLSALIAGPIIGDTFPAGHNAPLAIAEEYYSTICDGRKRAIDPEEVQRDTGSYMVDPITKTWIRKLSTIDDQCVEVTHGQQGGIYTWIVFGEKDAMHDVWADFVASPIITHFRWSALVELAFDNNREVFAPSAVFTPPLSTLPHTAPAAERYSVMKGLLALHIRRGDYAVHCDHLANFSSTFLAFNALPSLEPFHVPPGGGGWDGTTPENTALYRRRCFPTVAQIVARVREVQRSAGAAARGLESVYVMTNGAVPWVEELKEALLEMGGFMHVSSSRDTVLTWEQKYVAQAMDMLVGQRAQVFIGNGWSSVSGGVSVMRLANGFHPDTTQFFFMIVYYPVAFANMEDVASWPG